MRKVNITLEFENDEEAFSFQEWIKKYVSVFDFTLLSDTKEMYEKDSHFRKITSEYKKAKKIRDEYINKHNK